jgi:hypothetical protein
MTYEQSASLYSAACDAHTRAVLAVVAYAADPLKWSSKEAKRMQAECDALKSAVDSAAAVMEFSRRQSQLPF